ncbi:MAG: hypothetical protein R3F62_17040 [Planctomycetota bacterium]
MDDDAPSGSVLPALLMTVLGLLAMVVVVSLAVPSLVFVKQSSARPRCSNHVRQLALCGLSYASDKRFYPHVGSLRQHDGDWTTQDALRVYEALFRFGYLDSSTTDLLVCPSSSDVPRPTAAWTFAQVPRSDSSWTPLDPSRPLATPDSLASAAYLSYGWTRRPLNSNAGANTLLTADRSLLTTTPQALPGTRGNHAEGWHVARADASSSFLLASDPSSPFTTLGAITGPDAGHLAMEWAGNNPAGKTPPR